MIRPYPKSGSTTFITTIFNCSPSGASDDGESRSIEDHRFDNNAELLENVSAAMEGIVLTRAVRVKNPSRHSV